MFSLLAQIVNSTDTATIVSQTPQVIQNVIVQKEWWEKLLDYSGWTIAGAVMLYLVFHLGRALIDSIPSLIKRIISFLDALEARQDKAEERHETVAATLSTAATTQSKMAQVQEACALGIDKLAKTTDPLSATLKDLTEVQGKHHEFLTLSLDMLEEYVGQTHEPTLTIDWKRHIAGMRRSLQANKPK